MNTNIEFKFDKRPYLCIKGTDCRLRENGDFWRLHLDCLKTGMNRELGVYSHMQKDFSVFEKGNTTSIVYSSLIAEDGSVRDIKLELVIEKRDGVLNFKANMKNNSETRINELQYPLFEFERVNGDFEKDELYVPFGLGMQVKNPHNATKNDHTEYMAADYKNIWSVYSYPGDCSMPWIGIQSGEKYLYMGYHGKISRITSMLSGTEPRNSNEKYLILALASYPAVYPGESLTYDGFVLAAFDGDWRCGADFFRKEAEKTWYTPIESENGKKITGWQRIILKHQYGEIFHRYDELPKIYREGMKYGINMLLVFAWWQEGMDNGYPNYLPDTALGGTEKLKDAIKEINSLGGTVLLYANGHIMDVSAEYYKTEGHKYTIKDIDKNEYREFYKFSNNGTLLRRGYKTFATGCHASSGWTSTLFGIEKRHLELGANGTFFDQMGSHFEFCFDETHDHGLRIDLEPEYRVKSMKKMREMLPTDKDIISMEFVVDRLATLMDVVHGSGFGMEYTEDCFPCIFRYTFPNIIMSNRLLHDEREGWMRQLNYAFIHGLIFDISIYRGRAKSIEEVPAYAAHIKKLVDLRLEYIDFFTKGKYDLLEDSLPDGIKGVKYTYEDKSIAAIWNDTEKPVSLYGKDIAPQSVSVCRL